MLPLTGMDVFVNRLNPRVEKEQYQNQEEYLQIQVLFTCKIINHHLMRSIYTQISANKCLLGQAAV